MDKELYGHMNHLNLRVLIALSRTNKRVLKRSAAIFNAGGLTTAQFAVLDVLYHKGSLSINQITQSVLSTGGNMTVVINNMEKLKLISRCIDPEDKRSNLISITDEGRRRFEVIFPNHLKDLEKFFSPLTDEEKNSLLNLLKKIGSGD